MFHIYAHFHLYELQNMFLAATLELVCNSEYLWNSTASARAIYVI
jgi:hypothetical protein